MGSALSNTWVCGLFVYRTVYSLVINRATRSKLLNVHSVSARPTQRIHPFLIFVATENMSRLLLHLLVVLSVSHSVFGSHELCTADNSRSDLNATATAEIPCELDTVTTRDEQQVL